MAETKKIKSPLISGVHGRGLWVRLEFNRDLVSARRMCEVLKDKGLLSKETHDTVVRLAPPLVITKAEIDLAIETIKSVVAEVEAAL